MKKKITVICVIALCLSISIVGTLAYFIDAENADNVITVGNVDIDLVEKTEDPDDPDNPKDWPEEGFEDLTPGEEVSKIVYITNTGKNDAWVRIKVEQVVKSADGEDMPLVLEDGTPVMSIDYNDVEWFNGEDGYFYYKTPVKPGDSTKALFEEVVISPKVGNEYANSRMEVIVSAQAVQSDNNPIPAGGDVTDIVGWPAEN